MGLLLSLYNGQEGQFMKVVYLTPNFSEKLTEGQARVAKNGLQLVTVVVDYNNQAATLAQ